MSWVAAAIAGSALVGVGGAIYSSNKQKQASDQALGLQKQGMDNSLAIYNQTRADLDPYRSIGGNALVSLAQLYGLGGVAGGKPAAGFPTSGAGNNSLPALASGGMGGRIALQNGMAPWAGESDASSNGLNVANAVNSVVPYDGSPQQPFGQASIDAFLRSPDYQFALTQGMRGLDFSNAAKGMLKSGGHLKDLVTFNQGLATQQFGNYVNRLMQLTSVGQSAAAGGASNGLAFANQQTQGANAMAGATLASGQASAAGIVGATNAVSGGLSSFANNLHLANLINGNRVGGTTPVGAPLNLGGYGGAATPGWGSTPGMYADGGYPPVGEPAIVGERGPELFVPTERGAVIPNELLRAAIEIVRRSKPSMGLQTEFAGLPRASGTLSLPVAGGDLDVSGSFMPTGRGPDWNALARYRRQF